MRKLKEAIGHLWLLDQVKGWKKRYWELNEQCNIQVQVVVLAQQLWTMYPTTSKIHGSATDQDLYMLKVPGLLGYPAIFQGRICACILGFSFIVRG